MEGDELDYLLPQDCQNTYFDTWDRHNSIAFTTATKGLHNAPGENNCFVNSAVQVFWHLDVFRRSYRRLSGHTCMGNSCIFCALKVIFTQFQFSDQSSLHPDALRKALAETFVNQQRFQLGHMDDAAECFENILRRIHFHIASNCHEDSCTAPHCLPHQKFSLNIIEKVVCPCGASSSPLKFTEMVHYISAKALVSQAQSMQEKGDMLHPDRFGLLLRSANAMGDIRDCPGGCGKSVQIRRTLLNSPDVVSIGLVWDSDHPTVETTTEVARNIGTTILLQDVFHSVVQDLRTLPKLHLVGLVCYYGKHYSTFVFHSKLQVWIYFDDATVREIGRCWEDVVDKCSKGRYQPLLLLYANPNANPVPVETAPKVRTMAPGYGIPGCQEDENSLNRKQEVLINQHPYQRSWTPNPEHQIKKQTLLPRARSVTPSACEWENGGISSVKSSDHSRQQSFIMAVSTKPEKVKQPVFGGQASTSGSLSGPMMPTSNQRDSCSSQSSSHENENYSDYTLSTSGQYKRPSMEGFEPARLPLTPNIKGHERKDVSKKDKEIVRADFVRYQTDNPRSHDTVPSAYIQHQGYLNCDPSNIPNLPQNNGKATSVFYQGEEHSHFRQRSLSQTDDNVYGVESLPNNGNLQHTIIKPMANSQNYDQVDGMAQSHTPVQSGLATLPRKKKELVKDVSSLHSQVMQDQSKIVADINAFEDQRFTVNVAGRPPPVPGKFLMSADAEKVSEAEKKVKKTKKDLKKTEKKKIKSEMSRSQPDLSGAGIVTLNLSQTNDDMQQSKEFTDDKITYIDRRMVESILKHQGLQRIPSSHSTNSSSSIDSDSIMGKLLASKRGEGGTTTDASFDNVSLNSHKDSGYGSSDRNSSSSTGSGTVDPYIQYFISKSMVVPRNLNPQLLQLSSHQMVSDFSTPKPQVYKANLNSADGQRIDLSTLSREEMNRHLYETLTNRKVMHPIKESSQEDILKVVAKDQASNSTVVRGQSPLLVNDGVKGGRAPPIPPKNFAAFQVSKSSHQREPSIDSLDKDEVENDYFISMCEKADDLMDNCIIAETKGDLTAALRYCDSALGCLKEAMNQTDISNKALVYAQKKHNACLLKSRSLFKRTASQGSSDGKRSSITSSDSDNSDKPLRRATSKERLLALSRGNPRQGHHSQQGSTGNSTVKSGLAPQVTTNAAAQVRDCQPVGVQPCPTTCAPQIQQSAYTSAGLQSKNVSKQQHLHPHHPRPVTSVDKSDSESVHSQSSSVQSSSSVASSQHAAQVQASAGVVSHIQTASSSPAPLDAYGTLSRNRQPRRTSDPSGSSQAYKAYMSRQAKVLNTSGSDSSGGDGNIKKKMSQAEVRGNMEGNTVQRQMQHSSSQSQKYNLPERQQVVDSKSLVDQRLGTGNNGNISVGNDGILHTQLANTYVERSFNNSQGSNVPATVSQTLQQQHRDNSYQSTVSSNKSVPYTISSQQQSSGNVQLLQQPGASQSHSHHQTLQQQHLQSSRFTGPGQASHIVSGYSQPLPGQRSRPTFSSDVLSENYSQLSYQPNLQNQGLQQSQNIKYKSEPQVNTTQVTSSQSNTQYMILQTSNDSHRSTQDRLQNVTQNIQNVSQNIQNLSISRKSNTGQPPPPPARTTSNPDFKQQLPVSQLQQHHQQYYKENNLQQDQKKELEVGSNFHTPECKQVNLVSDRIYTLGNKLKHATSSTGLNYISLSPRPLERYASQPDCQNLVDPASNSTKDFLPSSFTQDHMMSSNAIARSEMIQKDGINKNLQQISDPLMQPCSVNSAQDQDVKPSVRALASRFDSSPDKPALKPKPPSVSLLSRIRSRSESGSKKPKSVLKNKKNKNSKTPRKSVTFADNISSLAAGYESAAELTSFSTNGCVSDRAYFSDDDDNFACKATAFSDNDIDDGIEDSSNSDDIAMVREELACHLCRKREIEIGKAYCSKCSFYMSRLVQS